MYLIFWSDHLSSASLFLPCLSLSATMRFGLVVPTCRPVSFSFSYCAFFVQGWTCGFLAALNSFCLAQHVFVYFCGAWLILPNFDRSLSLFCQSWDGQLLLFFFCSTLVLFDLICANRSWPA